MKKKNKSEPKRAILLTGPDKELPITRGVKINIREEGRQFIHIDQMKDGNWRLCFTAGVVEEWSEIKALVMLREEDGDFPSVSQSG